jgi:hypothetical protein
MALLITRTRRTIAVGTTIALAACGGGGGPTAPTCVSTGNGRMSATVAGTAFTASQFATATYQNTTVNGPNIVQVNGVECALTPGVARQILITIGRTTPIVAGTYPLDPASQGVGGYSGIGQYIRVPGLWYSNLRDGATAGTGTITFTTVSSTRLVGSFTFTAVPASSNGAADRATVAVSSGTFDIPIP